eukprot:12691283-Alexandrium_andersonii.AAC.1
MLASLPPHWCPRLHPADLGSSLSSPVLSQRQGARPRESRLATRWHLMMFSLHALCLPLRCARLCP